MNIEKPLFTPHEIPSKLRVSFKKNNTDLLEEISKRLQNLDMTSLASSSQNNQIKRVNTIDKKKQERPKVEEYIENLQNQFKDLNINRIANERDFHGKPLRSRISRTRYPGNVSITKIFYPRPTPPDLQYEEREVGLIKKKIEHNYRVTQAYCVIFLVDAKMVPQKWYFFYSGWWVVG